MKYTRLISGIIVAVVIMIVRVACFSSKDDPSAMLKAILDVQYRGETEQFVALKLGTKEKADRLHEEFYDGAEDFIELLIGEEYRRDEEMVRAVERLFKNMGLKAEYTVGEASKQKNGVYLVNVSCKKMHVLVPGLKKADEDTTNWVEELVLSGEDSDMSEEEFAQRYFQIIIDSLQYYIDNPQYDLEEVVQVELIIKGSEVSFGEDAENILGNCLFDWNGEEY